MKKLIIVSLSVIFVALGSTYIYNSTELEKDGDRVIAFRFNDELHIVDRKLNDGPYMRIFDDTTLIVSYLCEGELLTSIHNATDEYEFTGECHDSQIVYNIPLDPPQVEPNEYDSVNKIFVFSDVHGRYNYTVELLQNNEIIDTETNWSFGDGFLVLDGDLFDRGRQVTELLWLIYKLEHQAKEAGGRVVYTLGNHDAMIMIGDLRNLHWKYTELTEKKLSMKYDQLFDGNSVLGRWLRTKHPAVRINNILFNHPGINPEIVRRGYSLDFLSQVIRKNLDTPYDSIKQDEFLTFMFRSEGPLWYRGYFHEMEKYPHATVEQVDSVLDYFNVDHVVIGHAVVDSITLLYYGRVIGINQDYEIRDEYEGLRWEDGRFEACDIEGNRRDIVITIDK
jgi:hypothetical protein